MRSDRNVALFKARYPVDEAGGRGSPVPSDESYSWLFGKGQMSESSSYAIAKDLLRNEPDLHAFLVAIFQFGVMPPAGDRGILGKLFDQPCPSSRTTGRDRAQALRQPRSRPWRRQQGEVMLD